MDHDMLPRSEGIGGLAQRPSFLAALPVRATLPEPTAQPLLTVAAHSDLVDNLRAAEDRARQADHLNISLMAQIELLRAQLAKASAERDFYRGVSMDITTRLDVIQHTIATAVDAARAHAKVGMVSIAMQDAKNPAG